MDPDPYSTLDHIYLLIVLIIINGAFVAGEYALISCDPNIIRDPENRRKRKSAVWLLDHSELSVASIQLGITVCSLLIGWIGVDYFHLKLSPFFHFALGSPLELLVPLIFSVLVLTVIHVIFGELVVKAMATSFPEVTLYFLAGPIKLFTLISYPLGKIAYVLANIILKPFQLTIGQSDDSTLSIAEIKRLFSSVPSTSELRPEQARMIRGVVGFSETVAREIMTPRTDLVTVKVGATFDEVLEVIVESGFSRVPVRGDRVDDVLGILLARDVMPYLVEGKKESFDVRKVMRQCFFIPGAKPIDDLLAEFKKRKQHMAVILDEHGGLDGVVTLEDLLEEIVGNIYDESDDLEREVVQLENGDYIVDGGLLVADLNERYGLKVPEGEYDTIAGFLFTVLGRIPKISDKVFISKEADLYINSMPYDNNVEMAYEEALLEGGLCISMNEVQGHRIESVKMSKVEPKKSEEELSEESNPASLASIESSQVNEK